jgi:hypothetical protein
MSLSQKLAWGQLSIFAAIIIGWLTLFIYRGTIFYWHDDSTMMIFYILAGIGFALLVLMNVTVGIIGIKRGRKAIISDERDKSIFRKASLWATGLSYTVVVALLLVLAITYMNQGSEAIPVYFPLFIVLVGGVTLVLTQAIVALVLYSRKVSYGES